MQLAVYTSVNFVSRSLLVLLCFSSPASIACPALASLEDAGGNPRDRFVSDHAFFKPTTLEDHLAYQHEVAQLPVENRGVLFVDAIALRELGDIVFLNRDYAHAVTNYFTRVFFEDLASSGIRVRAKYSDYATSRIVYEGDAEVVRSKIAELMTRAGKHYTDSIAPTHLFGGYFTWRKGLLGRPSLWHLGAIGATEAIASTRVRRMAKWVHAHPERLGEFSKYFSHDGEFEFREELARFTALRSRLNDGFPERLLESHQNGNGANRILSKTVLTIVSEVSKRDQLGSLSDPHSALRTRIRKKTRHSLSPDQIQLLLSYGDLLQFFRPSFFVRDQRLVVMRPVKNDFIWFDVSKQKTENLYALQKALLEIEHQRDGRLWYISALEALSSGQREVSREFERVLGHIPKMIEGLNLRGDRKFSRTNGILTSGDEGAFVSKNPLSLSDFQKLVDTLARYPAMSNGTLREFHLVGYFQHGVNSRVSDESKLEALKTAERMEELIREGALRVFATLGLPTERIERVVFAVAVFKQKVGHRYELVMSKGLSESEEQTVRRLWNRFVGS